MTKNSSGTFCSVAQIKLLQCSDSTLFTDTLLTESDTTKKHHHGRRRSRQRNADSNFSLCRTVKINAQEVGVPIQWFLSAEGRFLKDGSRIAFLALNFQDAARAFQTTS